MSSPNATALASHIQRATIITTRNSPRPSRGRHVAPGQLASPRAAAGSVTQTITPDDTASSRSVSPDPLVLRLRGAHEASGSNKNTSNRRRIQWAEDVVDNEGLGRQSSKVCCIYHKTRAFGESSSEEDSSSTSSSDGESGDGGSDSPGDGGARMTGNRRGRKNGHRHEHKHGDDCGRGQGKERRKSSPNAYEKMPKYNRKQGPMKR